MLKYKVAVAGKIVLGHKYNKVFKEMKKRNLVNKMRFVLDYTMNRIISTHVMQVV